MTNPNAVINPDHRILYTLTGLAAHFGKGYCFPSQAKILALLAERAHRHMSRRTLNRHLRALESRGLIVRRRRHERRRPHGFVLRSTLYSFTAMTYALMRHVARGSLLWLSRSRVPHLAQYVTHMLGRLEVNRESRAPSGRDRVRKRTA